MPVTGQLHCGLHREEPRRYYSSVLRPMFEILGFLAGDRTRSRSSATTTVATRLRADIPRFGEITSVKNRICGPGSHRPWIARCGQQEGNGYIVTAIALPAPWL
ncbi:hypothetical protein RRG08_012668 [Elysia crispata]|uniref:Uncharacterized protein n=1 Tax=Elysia crispata TaxID=231223 RepID=A0AAE1D1C8_9GAST|nr:hypothetical protein RRG08_012668 [Elysia crispata]